MPQREEKKIPPGCHDPVTHMIRRWSQRSAATLDRETVNVVLSPLYFTLGTQIGDVICPIKEALEVSLLSLSWWIAFYACQINNT